MIRMDKDEEWSAVHGNMPIQSEATKANIVWLAQGDDTLYTFKRHFRHTETALYHV